MKIKEFRFLRTSDIFDIKYETWSRIYEYPAVLKEIITSFPNTRPRIHNSSWGFEGTHVLFRDDLDKIGDCTHSDIVKSEFRDTCYYDITQSKPEFRDTFDIVINISTIEHIKPAGLQIAAMKNLFEQVKPGGFLLLTFDYPRVNLRRMEKLTGSACDRNAPDRLKGSNSVLPAGRWRHRRLSIVYLAIQKQDQDKL